MVLTDRNGRNVLRSIYCCCWQSEGVRQRVERESAGTSGLSMHVSSTFGSISFAGNK